MTYESGASPKAFLLWPMDRLRRTARPSSLNFRKLLSYVNVPKMTEPSLSPSLFNIIVIYLSD